MYFSAATHRTMGYVPLRTECAVTHADDLRGKMRCDDNDGYCEVRGYTLHLWHCGNPVVLGISDTRWPAPAATMSQILNLSRHASDEEAQYLTSLLIYHLVDRCGGQLQFTPEEIRQIREDLSSKMVQIQLGDNLRLRIINRLPELQ